MTSSGNMPPVCSKSIRRSVASSKPKRFAIPGRNHTGSTAHLVAATTPFSLRTVPSGFRRPVRTDGASAICAQNCAELRRNARHTGVHRLTHLVELQVGRGHRDRRRGAAAARLAGAALAADEVAPRVDGDDLLGVCEDGWGLSDLRRIARRIAQNCAAYRTTPGTGRSARRARCARDRAASTGRAASSPPVEEETACELWGLGRGVCGVTQSSCCFATDTAR